MDLEEPEIYYEFHGHGLQLNCDRHEIIQKIFMDSEFDESLVGISFYMSRFDVLERYGQLVEQRGLVSHPILGQSVR